MNSNTVLLVCEDLGTGIAERIINIVLRVAFLYKKIFEIIVQQPARLKGTIMVCNCTLIQVYKYK